MSFSVGDTVVSVAGHDDGSLYIIVAQDNGTVWVADGKTKKLDAPKKKNSKHLRYVCSCDTELGAELAHRAGDFLKERGTGDARLRRMLKAAALNIDNIDKR